MSSPDLWQSYRDWLYDNRDLGFRLDISRMDMPGDILDRMGPPLERAFTAMRELEAGGLANPDEKRMVGHYWLRKPSMAPLPETSEQIESALNSILEFTDKVLSANIRPETADRFQHFLVIGIGGSALGPQFVAKALAEPGSKMTPHFLDNTDPQGIDDMLATLGDQLRTTLAIIVSKSGGTPETRNGMLETAAAFKRARLNFGQHAVAITQDGSKLDDYALEHDFVARFPMWDWVGGRTSEMSAVGLLPAALQGIDIRQLLAGAAAMDEATRSSDIKQNPAALLALAWHHAGDGRGAKDMVILPYSDRLSLLSRYLQQLVMESLGKERDLDGNVVHQGIAVYGNKGSTDQHAYVQQLREGVPNFFATFVEVLVQRDAPGLEVEPGVTAADFLQGFLIGTRQALYDNGRGSLTITVDKVTASSVGGLIALYERAVGLYATLVNVNAYHQPGVEAGKKAAADVLELQSHLSEELRRRAGTAATCETLAAAVNASDKIDTVFMLLERLAASPGRGVQKDPGSTPFDAGYRS
jgi:glucose-6-phosphate isomerase